jgi:ABC-type Fe3+/spermidine/putrescine transport system ATPase subunit
MVSIAVSGLSKRFGAAPVLKDIDLRIEHGELFFLLGPSGCGKTTLLRHIAGFYQPDAGRILFDREDVTDLPAHRRDTGMMFQSYALWPHLTVAENIAFGLEERRCPKAEIRGRVEEALALVQLPGLGSRRIQQLSGGQQQRVALARALVVRPKCLLLDEPLSNLDARLRLEMRSEIRRICKEFGLTGIYVTHDREEALSMADRMAVMDAGEIAQVGAPLEVYRNPESRMVADFIGETNFIQGRVVESLPEAGRYRIETALGQCLARAHRAQWRPEPGCPVVLSVRPEALYFADGAEAEANRFSGRIVAADYLGPSVQYRVQATDSLALKITAVNPSAILQPFDTAVTVAAGVEDVVMLPA